MTQDLQTKKKLSFFPDCKYPLISSIIFFFFRCCNSYCLSNPPLEICSAFIPKLILRRVWLQLHIMQRSLFEGGFGRTSQGRNRCQLPTRPPPGQNPLGPIHCDHRGARTINLRKVSLRERQSRSTRKISGLILDFSISPARAVDKED